MEGFEILKLIEGGGLLNTLIIVGAFLLINWWKSKGIYKKLLSELQILKEEVKDLVDIHYFRKKLKNAISEKAFEVIRLNPGISKELIHILDYTQLELLDFAEKYADSNTRHDKANVRRYLRKKAESIKDSVKHVALETFKGEKKGLNYDDFAYKNSRLLGVIEGLIETLVKNGLSNDEYIDLFENFIENLFTEQIYAWRKWNGINVE